MALKINGSFLYLTPGRLTGSFDGRPGSWQKGGLRNRFAGGFSGTFGAYPSGGNHPNAYVLPQKPGAISSYTRSNGALTPGTNTLVPAVPMSVNTSGSITVTAAVLDQIISLVSNLSGNISVTTAQLSAAAGIAVSASGAISLTSAQLGAIISMICSPTGAISPAANMTALANLSSTIGGPTPLSPEGLAQAVWNALTATYQAPGSMGEAVGNAGAGANPWDELLSASTTDGTFGKRIQELLTKNQYLGLK